MSEREKLIRDYWRVYGKNWDAKKIGPVFHVPVRQKISPTFSPDGITEPAKMDILTFRYTRGFLDGKPAYRITCEDVVVQEWLLRECVPTVTPEPAIVNKQATDA